MYFNIDKISKQIFRVSMFNNRNIGNCVFSIKKNRATINNLYINAKFRGENKGSILLQKTENVIDCNFNIKNINLLAYEIPFGNLIKFYESNGYIVSPTQFNNFFDDGEYLYNLVNMEKIIN